jgi:hypothetical protein
LVAAVVPLVIITAVAAVRAGTGWTPVARLGTAKVAFD